MYPGILLPGADAKERTFYVVGSFDPRTHKLGPGPKDLNPRELRRRIRQLKRAGHWEAAQVAGGAGELRSHPLEAPPCTPLRTLELFAGCGGLGEGMRQVGRWGKKYMHGACVYTRTVRVCVWCNAAVKAPCHAASSPAVITVLAARPSIPYCLTILPYSCCVPWMPP